MPVFHPLRVADVRRETADTVSVAFVVPDELTAAYVFEPGQHLTIRIPGPEGDEVRRSYSISSGVDDGELRVAVKNIPGGVFGAYAADRLQPARRRNPPRRQMRYRIAVRYATQVACQQPTCAANAPY